MNQASLPRKIVLIGNYPPRQCGIATFTQDVHRSLTQAGAECLVINVSDREEGYETPEEVVLEIPQEDENAYIRAAEYAKSVGAQMICVEHEFGIYGGRAGRHLLAFLERVGVPIVVQLHTILEEPTEDQAFVMEELKRLASRFIVMSRRGCNMLVHRYGIDADRIDVVPHGIPDVPFIDPAFFKDQFSLSGRRVLLTFGLLSPNKGIEHMIQAMPAIVERHPDVAYVVLGATHPHIVRDHGESYRDSLIQMAEDLGVAENVRFESRFVDLEELTSYIGACDVYITPYLNKEQITSGTLAYAYGSGNAVVSTPYWHAEELLADGRGELVPFKSPEALSEAVCRLLDDEVARCRMRKQAYIEGREFVWSKIGEQLVQVFERTAGTPNGMHMRKMGFEMFSPMLPDISLEHLQNLTDSTGIFQHARYRFPSFRDGYCTDDNCRALVVSAQLMNQGDGAAARIASRLGLTYAAFMEHAWNGEAESFRNFMGFNREWMEEAGSNDCFGRCIWALGTCVWLSPDEDMRSWAADLYTRSLPGILKTDSLRAWANCIIGISSFHRRFPGHKASASVLRELAGRLSRAYETHRRSDWQWYEDSLTYDNAKLPEAMLAAGEMLGPDWTAMGLQSLEWLMDVQTGENGSLLPIGSNGFFPRGGERALFDQQPLEAWASVSACRRAYEETGNTQWRDEAMRAFRWFLGDNEIGAAVADVETGACHDGLQPEGVNLNCGAESTLSYIGSLTEIRQMAILKKHALLSS